MALTYLIDTSVLKRMGQPLVRAAVEPSPRTARSPARFVMSVVSNMTLLLEIDKCLRYQSSIRIGVREFRNNTSTYLSGSETIAVNRNGKVIGFYIPLAYIPLERDEDEVRRAVAKLGVAVGQVLEETGMTEEELAKVFELRRPMPE